MNLADPTENDGQDIENILEIDEASDDEESEQSEDDKDDRNLIWLDEDEKQQELEEKIFGDLYTSQALSTKKRERLLKRLEVHFNQEMYSIPFFEDTDLDTEPVNNIILNEDLVETKNFEGQPSSRIDFSSLQTANIDELDDDWCQLNYEFVTLVPVVSQPSKDENSLQASDAQMDRLSTALSAKDSLKTSLSMKKSSNLKQSSMLQSALDPIRHLYKPEEIPREEYMKCRPKEDKDKGIAGFFARFLGDGGQDQAGDEVKSDEENHEEVHIDEKTRKEEVGFSDFSKNFLL